jgi:hypothetical protein
LTAQLALAEREVVFGGAALVAVTLDADAGQRFSHVALVRAALSESLMAALSDRRHVASGRRLVQLRQPFPKSRLPTTCGAPRASPAPAVRWRGGVVGAAGIGGGAESLQALSSACRNRKTQDQGERGYRAVREYTFIVNRSSIPLGEKL